jgi:hypothetical protein
MAEIKASGLTLKLPTCKPANLSVSYFSVSCFSVSASCFSVSASCLLQELQHVFFQGYFHRCIDIIKMETITYIVKVPEKDVKMYV